MIVAKRLKMEHIFVGIILLHLNALLTTGQPSVSSQLPSSDMFTPFLIPSRSLMISSSMLSTIISSSQTSNPITTSGTQAQSMTSSSLLSASMSASSFSTSSPFSTSSSSDSRSTVMSTTQTQTSTPVSTSGNKDPAVFSQLKNIYIIAGVIMFLVLIIIILVAAVGIMCQRSLADRKRKRNKHKRSPVPPTSVQVQTTQPQSPKRQTPPQISPKRQIQPQSSPHRHTQPLLSPKRNKDNTKSNEVQQSSSMSDYPLLCLVLQNYDSSQHQARKMKLSSSSDFESSTNSNDIPKTEASNNLESSVRSNSSVFNSPPHQLPHISGAPSGDLELSTKSNGRISNPYHSRLFSGGSSDFESSLGKSTTVSYVSDDSHDYDELEPMMEGLKLETDLSPKRKPHKANVNITGRVTISPKLPQIMDESSELEGQDKIIRSQSADDIFDDPKYTRLSLISPTCIPPTHMLNPIPEDDLTLHNLQDTQEHVSIGNKSTSPIMVRSKSTPPTGDDLIENQKKYKQYMSLQQLLEIMESKIPSRETSVEIEGEEKEEELYCPRVLRPMKV